MATKAYILIKVKAGRTKDVLQSLKRLAGVEQAHSCFGQPDIFVFISVNDHHKTEGVEVARKFAALDFQHFFAGPLEHFLPERHGMKLHTPDHAGELF